MDIRKIKVNSGGRFLNWDDLPHNCIFNKVVTGCGGTTIALFNEENYVIAVPTTDLITGKTDLFDAGVSEVDSPDMSHTQLVFGLFGQFTGTVKDMLREYDSCDCVKKIICTYDKLPYLQGLIRESDYRLLVDEYHGLLKDYGYRDEAINGVLSCFRNFKSYCFMSATPICTDFVPDALEGLPTYEAVWPKMEKVTVYLHHATKPYYNAAQCIKELMKDGYYEFQGIKAYELFFFLNSVNDISRILHHCRLSNDDVRIICANTPENAVKLKGYSISTSKHPNKPVNMITRKCFEGVDFYSDTGLSIIVSNTRKTCTMLDVGTEVFQIAGRIRNINNPFRSKIKHIFNSNQTGIDIDPKKTWEEMLQETNDALAEGKKFIVSMNTFKKFTKRVRDKGGVPYTYMDEEGIYHINDIEMKFDLFNFKIMKMMYNGEYYLSTEYADQGADVGQVERSMEQGGLDRFSPKRCFKDVFLEYAGIREEARRDNKMLVCFGENPLVVEQPLIKRAYEELGIDEVRRLRYSKVAIEEALDDKSRRESKEDKLARIVAKSIKPGFVSNFEIKSILAQCYGLAGIMRVAKASDITKWFDCQEMKTTANGKSIRGYKIYHLLNDR